MRMMIKVKPKLIPLKEVAYRLGKDQNTIRNWVRGWYTKNGKTHHIDMKFPPSYRLGRQLSFREDEIEQWIENQRTA